MTNQIRKLNQLKTIESFIQVNLFKGYKYIDKAGEIVNSLYQATTPPKFTMNLNGLVVQSPDDISQELKISSDSFWVHYVDPHSLDQIATAYTKKLDQISKILEVEKITRVGWRNYFIYEYSSLVSRDNSFNKFSTDDQLIPQSLVYSMKINSISFMISLSKVMKNDHPQTSAILLDIDSFISYKDPESISKSTEAIKRIKEALHSNEIITIINNILK